MCPSGLPPQIRSPEGTNASFASVGFTATRGWWMNWGRPRARLPPLLTECCGRSHLPPVVSLCRCCSRTLHRVSRTERSKIKGRRSSQSTQGPQRVQGFLAVAPGLVNECRGRGTPARFESARAAKPITSRQVECGKTEKGPSHSFGSTTRTPEHEEH